MTIGNDISRRWPLTFAVAIVCAAGCGRSAGNAPAVTGLVTLDGKPLDVAAVTFLPVEGTRGLGAVGLTGKDGRYVAKPPGSEQTLSAGTYKVTISRYVLAGGAVFEPNDETSPLNAGAEEQLPPRYSDPDATVLTADLLDDDATINFELTTVKKR